MMSTKNDSKVCDGMKQILAETYVLYLQTQQFHWNITGVHFSSLHAMFGDQYTELATAIDEIAEHIRALGQLSPGSLSEFSRLSSFASVETADGPDEDLGMVAHLLEAHEALLATLQTVLQDAQATGDEVTADLIIQRQRVHSKTSWMLRATLGE